MLDVSSPYNLLGHSWSVVYHELAGLIYRSEKVENDSYITEVIQGSYGAIDIELHKKGLFLKGDKFIFEIKQTQKWDNVTNKFSIPLQADCCHFCKDLFATTTKNSKRNRCYTCNKIHERYLSKLRSRYYRRRKGLVPFETSTHCQNCNKEFIKHRNTAKFCSSKCRLQCHRANKSPAPLLNQNVKQK